MTIQDLATRVEKAFSAGQNKYGLELLRELNTTGGASAASHNRQAVIEEQIGDWTLAGRAHYACIETAPHVASAYLYAAYWLQRSKLIDAAASMYSLAQEADPQILYKANVETTKRERVLAGRKLLPQYLNQHHKSAAAGNSRIENASWVQNDAAAEIRPNPDYQPQLFCIPELSQKPLYHRSEFSWAQQLEAKTDAIQHELDSIRDEESLLRPYLEDARLVPSNLGKLAGSRDWSALDLYKDGQVNQTISEHFPVTIAALEGLPTYGRDGLPFEVFFSILRAGQSIPSHFGQSNHALTVHLPIDVPAECFLQVADKRHTWQRGELIAFDDNFKHSAHNNSDQDRTVLIFSIWHPELSLDEHTAVQHSFRARQTWMTSRREKLNQLIQ